MHIVKLVIIYLRQHFVFSSSSHAAALESETLFLQVMPVSKCLRLFDISSSSSSLELQFDVIESYWDPSCSLAKWQACSWDMSMLLLVLPDVPKGKGPDLLAGVLWRAGDELLIGVWHLEFMELPRGVISVPISLCSTSWNTSGPTPFIASLAEFLKRNPSFDWSENLKFSRTGFSSSMNLSAFANELQIRTK